MGVLEDLLGAGIDILNPSMLYSVIPFGTGNDLSQVIVSPINPFLLNPKNIELISDCSFLFFKKGWGRSIPGKDVAGQRLEKIDEIVWNRLSGMRANLDVWEGKELFLRIRFLPRIQVYSTTFFF